MSERIDGFMRHPQTGQITGSVSRLPAHLLSECPRCLGEGRLVVRNEYGVDFDVSCPDCEGEGLVA